VGTQPLGSALSTPTTGFRQVGTRVSVYRSPVQKLVRSGSATVVATQPWPLPLVTIPAQSETAAPKPWSSAPTKIPGKNQRIIVSL
jgi:hypothetical protein